MKHVKTQKVAREIKKAGNKNTDKETSVVVELRCVVINASKAEPHFC